MRTEMQASAENKSLACASARPTAFRGDASDILIPKLLIGQATSKAVQDDRIKFGEIFRSTTLEAVGGRDKPVAIIPLSHTKTWVVSQKVGGKFEFRQQLPYKPATDKELPWTWTADGSEWKREQSLNFYVLLPADVSRDLEARQLFADTGELPDVEASLLPCALSFKSTSYKAGKTLVTHFAKAADFAAQPYISIFNLYTDKTMNDQGTFYTLRVERYGKTPLELIPTCEKWQALVAGDVKVDDSDLAGATVDVTPAGGDDLTKGMF